MKKSTLLFAFTVFFLSLSAGATSLRIRNSTGAPMRIADLSNRCDGYIIQPTAPVDLAVGEDYLLPIIRPVMHMFTVCGSGLCQYTSMPIRDDIEYLLNVILVDGIIDSQAIPDHWIGNTECPATTPALNTN